LQLGRLVLDRSGFHPSLTLEQAPITNPFVGLSEDALIAKLESLLEQAKQQRDRNRALPPHRTRTRVRPADRRRNSDVAALPKRD
jgi:hypothetical protein